jgi:hypothetical protein
METLTYELFGSPEVQTEHCDEWETVMTCEIMRSDGVIGTNVWIVAGVPDYLRGAAQAAASNRGPESVRVHGDTPDGWCPESFRPVGRAAYREIASRILAAVADAALTIHRGRA